MNLLNYHIRLLKLTVRFSGKYTSYVCSHRLAVVGDQDEHELKCNGT